MVCLIHSELVYFVLVETRDLLCNELQATPVRRKVESIAGMRRQ